MPEVEVLKVRDAKVTPGVKDSGIQDRHLLGNVHLGGRPTNNLALMATVFEPGKRGSGPHKHDVEQAIFIVKGKGKAVVGDKEYALEPDTLVYLPVNEVHDLSNTGNEPLVFVAVLSKSSYSYERI